jgi:hypothetical protein
VLATMATMVCHPRARAHPLCRCEIAITVHDDKRLCFDVLNNMCERLHSHDASKHVHATHERPRLVKHWLEVLLCDHAGL